MTGIYLHFLSYKTRIGYTVYIRFKVSYTSLLYSATGAAAAAGAAAAGAAGGKRRLFLATSNSSGPRDKPLQAGRLQVPRACQLSPFLPHRGQIWYVLGSRFLCSGFLFRGHTRFFVSFLPHKRQEAATYVYY